jgi:uncharacterized membrane protein
MERRNRHSDCQTLIPRQNHAAVYDSVMNRLTTHFRSKFIAGVLAAIPIGITIFIIVYVDSITQRILPLRYPLLGIVLALVLIYFLGIFVTSFLGRHTLQLFDRVLGKLPGLRDFYRTWKQVLVTPELNSGVFARAVLIPDESGRVRMLGFTSGRAVPGNADLLCVFVPNTPNPIVGRLYFVSKAECLFLNVPTRDALKFVVSGGNYIPEGIGSSLVPSAPTSA